MEINIGSNYTVYATNWHKVIAPRQITNAVRDLAVSGDICRVFGHQWPTFDDNMLYVVNTYGKSWSRTCRICGKHESKTEGEWR